MTLLSADRALLDAFRRGEPGALEAVYRHYGEDLARMLTFGFGFGVSGRRYRFSGYRSRFDLEDAVAETFAKAFAERARLGYDGLSPYRPYLFGIARNLVIDSFRLKRNRIEQLGASQDASTHDNEGAVSDNAIDVLEGVVEASGDPARDLANADLAALVRGLRDALSADEEAVFRLRFDEGLSLPDAERRSGKTASQIKTLEKRVRLRFLSSLWESGYLDGYRPARRSWLGRLLATLTSTARSFV